MKDINKIKTARGEIEYTLEGHGPTVLLIHGGHGSCTSDLKQDQLLARGFSVLIPSRPGYKGTPLAAGKTAGDTAALFYELLKELGIEEVFVIGISAGGPTALEFARRYPRLVKKLILEAAVTKPWFHRLTVQYYGAKFIFNPKRQKRFWRDLKMKLAANEKKTFLKYLKLFTKLKPEYVYSRMSKKDVGSLKQAIVTGNDSGSGFVHDIEHRAKKVEEISCPTLIIHSKNDGSVPFSHAVYANRKIKYSELFAAETDSHFIYIGPGSNEAVHRRIGFLLAK